MLADRSASLRQPSARVPEQTEQESDSSELDSSGESARPQAQDGDPASAEPGRVITLEEALQAAVEGNRQYAARKEALYLQALTLASTRHSFAPQLSLTLDYIFSDTGMPPARDLGFSAGLDQVLPWGAKLRLDTSGNFAEGDDRGNFSAGAGIALTQPLLRGAGRGVSHEPLVQAERTLVYALRSFELYREDFSIDVARRYYDLVQRKQSIENLRQNLEGFVFGRRQAEALFQVDRTNELDVLRARRSELSSRDSLLAAEENFLLEADRFRIFLGLPTGDAVDVHGESPEFMAADFVVEEALEVALANRLDLLNLEEQLEDGERGLRLAKDRLRPQLDLTAGLRLDSQAVEDYRDSEYERSSIRAGLTLDLGVDRVRESNAWHAARIGQIQARRALQEFKDELRVGITSAFRELERRRKSLVIQGRLIEDQEKNVKIAQLRFDQGDFSNRDVVEAEEALLEARNSLINEQVNYEITRLRLLRDLGVLFIDDKGMWQE